MPCTPLVQLSSMVFYDTLPASGEALRHWLLLESSMTQRLTEYCQQISVCVINQGVINEGIANENTANDDQYCATLFATARGWLPAEIAYWRREIILYGDGVPWLAACTLAPLSTLCGEEKKLLQLGNTPLGHYLFHHANLKRDMLQPGRCDALWGRRSRLYLNQKPLLLTELFLAASPIYSK